MGLVVPSMGHHPWSLSAGLCYERRCLWNQGLQPDSASLSLLLLSPWPSHAAPVFSPYQEEFAGTELVCPNSPQPKPWARLGDSGTFLSAGAAKGQPEAMLRSHVSSQTWPGQLAVRCNPPVESDGCVSSFLLGREPPFQMSWKVPDAQGPQFTWMPLRVTSCPREPM